MGELGDRIRSEANIAGRPGQMARLQRIAREVDDMESWRAAADRCLPSTLIAHVGRKQAP